MWKEETFTPVTNEISQYFSFTFVIRGCRNEPCIAYYGLFTIFFFFFSFRVEYTEKYNVLFPQKKKISKYYRTRKYSRVQVSLMIHDCM